MKRKTTKKLPHTLPKDVRALLARNARSLNTWEDITPLARNEWICWIISPKLPETRARHVSRALEELAGRKRRPCCFAGCPHR